MPRKYTKKINKKANVQNVEEVLPPIVEDGYTTPDEGITMPNDITWAPKRKHTRNDDIGEGNNFYVNKFPKI